MWPLMFYGEGEYLCMLHGALTYCTKDQYLRHELGTHAIAQPNASVRSWPQLLVKRPHSIEVKEHGHHERPGFL